MGSKAFSYARISAYVSLGHTTLNVCERMPCVRLAGKDVPVAGPLSNAVLVKSANA